MSHKVQELLHEIKRLSDQEQNLRKARRHLEAQTIQHLEAQGYSLIKYDRDTRFLYRISEMLERPTVRIGNQRFVERQVRETYQRLLEGDPELSQRFAGFRKSIARMGRLPKQIGKGKYLGLQGRLLAHPPQKDTLYLRARLPLLVHVACKCESLEGFSGPHEYRLLKPDPAIQIFAHRWGKLDWRYTPYCRGAEPDRIPVPYNVLCHDKLTVVVISAEGVVLEVRQVELADDLKAALWAQLADQPLVAPSDLEHRVSQLLLDLASEEANRASR